MVSKNSHRVKEVLVWKLFSSGRSVADHSFSSSVRKLGFRCIVTNCRALVLPRVGGSEVLEIHSNVEIPDGKPNEVLVRARAVSINPLDSRMMSGYGRSYFNHCFF